MFAFRIHRAVVFTARHAGVSPRFIRSTVDSKQDAMGPSTEVECPSIPWLFKGLWLSWPDRQRSRKALIMFQRTRDVNPKSFRVENAE
jgi:hypothetical protein